MNKITTNSWYFLSLVNLVKGLGKSRLLGEVFPTTTKHLQFLAPFFGDAGESMMSRIMSTYGPDKIMNVLLHALYKDISLYILYYCIINDEPFEFNNDSF